MSRRITVLLPGLALAVAVVGLLGSPATAETHAAVIQPQCIGSRVVAPDYCPPEDKN